LSGGIDDGGLIASLYNFGDLNYHSEPVIFFHFNFKTRFVIVIIETRQKESK